MPDLLIFEPQVFGDSRGFFLEAYHQKKYADLGLNTHFVQDNLSCSEKGVLRGLHFQNPQAQGKLISVIQGVVFDVAVDIRVDSPTFSEWVAVELSGENKKQFWVPPGFAHGFCVLSAEAIFHYKCTDFYAPEHDGSIRWDDPDVGIDWPIKNPLLSDKDSQAPFLKEVGKERLNF